MKDLPSPEGLATVSDELKFKEKWHCGSSLVDVLMMNKEGAKYHGMYVDLPKKRVPESEAEFYHHPELKRAKVRQVDYGCKGASSEFALSGKHMCMHRPFIGDLWQKVAESKAGKANTIFVDGWGGSGKSMALYSLVAAAREKGWVVMYVPSASIFVQGGKYKKKDEDSPVWYTPVAAKHLLRGLYGSHKKQLEGIPAEGSQESLAAVCAKGIESVDDFEPVEATVEVLHGLLQADGIEGTRTLVVLDEYNYLYHRTEYHEVRMPLLLLYICIYSVYCSYAFVP